MKTSSTCHIPKCSIVSWVSAFSFRHLRGNRGHIQVGVPEGPKHLTTLSPVQVGVQRSNPRLPSDGICATCICPRESSGGSCLYPPPPSPWTKEPEDFRVEKGSFSWKLMLSKLRLQMGGGGEGGSGVFQLLTAAHPGTGQLHHHPKSSRYNGTSSTSRRKTDALLQALVQKSLQQILQVLVLLFAGGQSRRTPLLPISPPSGSSRALRQPHNRPSSPLPMDPKPKKPGLALPSIHGCGKPRRRGEHEGPLR